MKLYHGSTTIVESPQILKPSTLRTVDFGNGFYTTTDYEQACQWVRIKKDSLKSEKGFVSIYEIPDDFLVNPKYNGSHFPTATKEWLEFVVANRRDRFFSHDYDVVAGPVANDRVYTTIALYESHFLNAEETLKRLKTHLLVNQILFHTENSLKELRYIGYKEIL